MAHKKTARKPIDKGRIADKIFLDLKTQIVDGTYAHGSKLPTEKELAQHYAVSGPTLREAVRGLTAIGLVEVRHGSGAYVRADGASMMALSLSAFIQLERVEASDALGLLAVLNAHAATCAVQHATPADLRRLREAAESLGELQKLEQAASSVRAFHRALSSCAHNPLLAAICGFLSDLQVEFAIRIAGDSIDVWRTMFTGLHPFRLRIVDSIERRNAKSAARYTREFHAEAIRIITAMPGARDMKIEGRHLSSMWSSAVSDISKFA